MSIGGCGYEMIVEGRPNADTAICMTAVRLRNSPQQVGRSHMLGSQSAHKTHSRMQDGYLQPSISVINIAVHTHASSEKVCCNM